MDPTIEYLKSNKIVYLKPGETDPKLLTPEERQEASKGFLCALSERPEGLWLTVNSDRPLTLIEVGILHSTLGRYLASK